RANDRIRSTVSRTAAGLYGPGRWPAEPGRKEPRLRGSPGERTQHWRRRWSRLRRPARDGGDGVGEVPLAVVLGLVADLRLGAGQAPEPMRVAAYPINDQERHAVLVPN